MPRSGSTLLENILSLNSNVIDMGEVNFLEESIREIKDIKYVYDVYQKKVINQFKSSLLTLTKIYLIICTAPLFLVISLKQK